MAEGSGLGVMVGVCVGAAVGLGGSWVGDSVGVEAARTSELQADNRIAKMDRVERIFIIWFCPE
jgi:hypothetical protein